jgi:hypothetical protein
MCCSALYSMLYSIMFVTPAFQKINAKNAFSLQLIDYMAMMLKKQDSKMDNFQVIYVSCYSVHFRVVVHVSLKFVFHRL